ncbi:Metallo-dependent phosphatase-like protein [Kockovaella imperatae]|uniref:Metallo-dependent phosphatase-like protein n=1 Tax=Kockovaella imperatae TaxID=4999 RepID=A0A1Y1U8E9_9TREE|nr:Metallo-dependent phosphatase-like protein [Kockovaella imperatae]ORX34309.1 Metallo-dependent phosphatase-like protein [Kockovaella imperatae]
MPRLHDPRRRPPRGTYLRSCLPMLLVLVLLSILLSALSFLSRFKSPAAKQRLGWQAWEVIAASKDSADTSLSIPLDVWDPLASHETGITEITVKSCYLPPLLFPSTCAPATTPELDKTKGKWVMVKKDLNAQAGIWYLNVYYRRTRRLDTALITDVRLVSGSSQANSSLEGWTRADGDLHAGTWPSLPPVYLWYKSSEGTPVTEIDVIYGDADPFYGYHRVVGGKVTEAKAKRWESVDLAVRRGGYSPPRAKRPVFSSDGRFKIMQIADLHYSVGSGGCRDSDKTPCVGDIDTETWLAEALEAEKPDLVVFSGDQLNGQGTSFDARSVLAKFAKPVIDRQIPWCAVFGNHDSEVDDDREEQMRTLQSMPYSLARAGPADVAGVGNYLVKIHSSDPSHVHLFTLYFLDSHDYQHRVLPWTKPEYDYIKESQIDWYKAQSEAIKPIERPFRPDGASDLGKIWRRRNTRQIRTLAKPNAMMFFHIPLPEAYGPADISGYDGDELDVGDQLDGQGNSKQNSGFFHDAIKATYEAESEDGTPTAEIKVLSHGHCHNTDRCRRSEGIWMCFDGGSSYSGYGQLGFDRRVRMYQLSDYGEKVETYKRLTSGETLDHQILVGNGAAPRVGQDQV